MALAVVLAAMIWHINVFTLPDVDIFGIQSDELGEISFAFVFVIPAFFVDWAAIRHRRHETLVQAERQRAEVATRRLAAIVESSDDAIIGKDLNGVVTSWNRGAERIFGYTAAEMVGTSITRLTPPDRPEEEYQLVATLDRGESVRSFETIRQTKDGRLIDVSMTASLTRDQEGHVIGASTAARDVSERKRAESVLRETQARLAFALERSHTGGWDLDLRDQTAHRTLEHDRIFGYESLLPAWTYQVFLEHVLPDDRAEVDRLFQQAIATETDWAFECRIRRADDQVRWIWATGGHQRDGDGRARRLAGIVQDVTERHTLEAQYQQAQKMEAVGRLAGGVAHDFNNLLTAILGYSGLLLSATPADDPRRNDLAEIQKAGTSAASLTRQLLAFSRRQIIEPTLLNLNDVVSDMRGMLERVIGEDVTIHLGLQSDVPRVKTDRGQVEQIVMNLAVNARDAMPMGGTLTIETANVALDQDYAKMHRGVTPGSYVVLTVTDTGTGMTLDVQAHLFEPFFTTKELGKGTGLGLATVYGIATRSGGSVGVYSEVGHGTSFKVYFPRADMAEPVVEVPVPVLVRGAHPGTETVLVVEDSEGLRRLASRLLEQQGYSVLVAANAEEARRVFEGNRSIDVLLTDVVMPGGSGPELTKWLVEQRPGLHVIYMSGYTEDAIVQHGVLKAGIAFLHKPFTAETLGRKIREVLDGPVGTLASVESASR
jgi:two-component system cell cycle sensor histidine kinase/response regulator CckA